MSDLNDMANDFEKIANSLDNNLTIAMKRLASIAVADTQLVTPVLTGTLRRSMTVGDVDKTEDGYSVIYGPGAEAPYAQAVNDGHIQGSGFVKGRHFMETGWQNAEPKVNAEIENFIKKTFGV